MSSTPMPSFDGRLYRAALSLCPAGFRRDHGDEMARDFDEACHEAAADGDRALWGLRWLMAIDLVRTLAIQWVRTGFPLIAGAAIVLPLAIAEGLATVVRRAAVQIPDDAEHQELLGVLVLVIITVMLIAMTIVLSVWVGQLNRARRR